MLKRFEWIRDEGHFSNYQWDSSLPDFERINVIYGHNGSGKSSIARVLDGLRSTVDGHQRVSVSVDDGAPRTTSGQVDPVFDRVLVFSEEYVARSHRFRDGAADMAAVLTLGQRTTEDEVRLERLRADQRGLTTERDELQLEARGHERDLAKSYGRVAQAVVDDLASVRGIYTSRGTYSVAKVKTRLNELRDELVALQPEELTAQRQLISGGSKEPLPMNGFSLTISNDVVATATRLLGTTPVTIVLDSLRTHPEASMWVQDGSSLHQDSDTCIFCGSTLTRDRKTQIERHFSNEVAQLQHELGSLEQGLRATESEADAIAQRIPATGLLFDDLRHQFDVDADAVREQVLALKSWCAELRAKLSSKKTNTLAIVGYDLIDPPAIEGMALEAIRDTHNERVAEHTQLVQRAAQAIEIHHLNSEASHISDLLNRQSKVDTRLAEAIASLAKLGPEITGLETKEGDPTPSAEVLTREVARLLGRNELRFEALGDRYQVLRNGTPAIGLSVGERTAVTLVHFFEMVARFDITGGRPIVIIDDPVSSLDSNVFMGISTYIWSAAVSTAKDQIGQLFLLTHNFELFRQWDIQLDGLQKNASLKNLFPARLYELRSRHASVAGSPRRRPVLRAWPESPAARKKMRSSYHHSFLLMARAHHELQTDDSLENRLDAQLLFPNLIRRVLESFLAFKRPGYAGDFTNAMRETTTMLEQSGYKGDAEALRQQLTRYTHAYSHSETPDTNDIVNPDEIAGALAAVFRFMKQLDEGHFCGLCDVVGVDPEHLVPPTAPLGDFATSAGGQRL